MRVPKLVVPLMAGLLLLHPRLAGADCAGPPEPLEASRQASAIFYGRVTRVDSVCPPHELRLSERTPRHWRVCHQVVHLQVIEPFKNVEGRVYRLLAFDGSDGGLTFARGERWLIHALPPEPLPEEGEGPPIFPPDSPQTYVEGCQGLTFRAEGRNALTRASRKALRRLVDAALRQMPDRWYYVPGY